ncbi:hypothetical protein H4Q26_012784 [Puccinia striiformis f. sp. tritici PST-130]|uniref:Uncharacterized protein n=1 Tax=Puccinia striiformis f. sp. tritici PST-78 TaxID=1165861 RepID=A0A0L0VTT9_9BASI|nr:hypothetical protein Pst134EB_028771 [Puccinia striiformis f. sp. tritici]KAI9617918.1 hypothetical protein H4Q26_012784 [Puccinia striiformis f. sp. tritici PST-130]KNF02699.1 hypothetical protein PSTG_03987 [Puccinia striiformis f. sp. tritici PST-78]
MSPCGIILSQRSIWLGMLIFLLASPIPPIVRASPPSSALLKLTENIDPDLELRLGLRAYGPPVNTDVRLKLSRPTSHGEVGADRLAQARGNAGRDSRSDSGKDPMNPRLDLELGGLALAVGPQKVSAGAPMIQARPDGAYRKLPVTEADSTATVPVRLRLSLGSREIPADAQVTQSRPSIGAKDRLVGFKAGSSGQPGMHEHETILPAVARDLSPLYQFQAVPPHLRNSARPQLRRFPTLRYDSQRMRYVQANDKPFADLRVLRSGKASQVQLDSMRRSVLQLMANRKRQVGSTERGFPSKRQQKSPQNTANHASFDSIPDRGSSSSWTPVSIRKHPR